MQESRGNTSQYLPQRRLLAKAISAAVAGSGMMAVHAAQDGAQKSVLEEVVVTARKRTENLQDIPQAVVAFTTDDILRYGFKSVEDYARFIPSMNYVSTSPGQTKLVFRGVADSATPYIAEPTSAMYLDEQPLTTYSQTPEVRPVDIQRIEALSGPQGTLYGASSQSGTLRLITNKPDPTAFAANMNAGLGGVDHGELTYDVDGMVNIPLIDNKLAVRLVGFHAHDGGYIDNVLGLSWDKDAAGNPIRGPGTNADVVKNDVNSVEWWGARASIKWLVNDDWSATGMYNYQRSYAGGWNDFDPTVGDLKTVKFQKEWREDQWHQLGLTIEGNLGWANLVSATSYFNREINYQQDGTVYHAYLKFVSYYDHTLYPQYDVYNFGPQPSGRIWLHQLDRRWTQEVRLSHEGPKWNWTVGFFYQGAEEKWDYRSYHRNFAGSQAFDAWKLLYGPLPDTSVAWNSGESSTHDDIALFGEVSYNLTDKLTLTFGGRYYNVDVSRYYFVRQPMPHVSYILDVNAKEDGFLPKGEVQYHFTDDKMIYALYSEGFRTGGINRSRGNPILPRQYDSDLLKNYEAGVKTQWLDNRLQINASGYHMDWENIQLELTDPSYFLGEPYQTMVANIGSAVIDGIDWDISAVPTSGLELGFSATYLFSDEIAEQVFVTAPGLPASDALVIPKGSRLPLSPEFSAAAYAQYTFPVAQWNGDGYVRFQYSYTGNSVNMLNQSPEPFPRLTQASYDIGDLKIGFERPTWAIEAYINNLWDERPQIYLSNFGERYWGGDRVTTARPRNFGVKFRREF